MPSTLSALDAFWQQPISRQLHQQVSQFSEDQCFLVACSGGRDSLALARALHLLCPDRVRIIHINHQLQQPAGQWAAWLAQQCALWQLPCIIQAVTVATGNIEQQARIARYQAIFEHIQSHEVLVLGHHRQDQAETVLLRLMSGSGVVGLSAMKQLEQRREHRLWRPWLDRSRQEVTALAELICPQYIEDPANADVQFDRVMLRQQIWPMLSQRWPAFEQGMARTAMLMQDCQDILQEVVQADLQQCGNAERLDITRLKSLTEARQRLLLSRWMQGQEQYAPSLQHVEQLREEVVGARDDAEPQLLLQPWQFRRYQHHLFRLPINIPVAEDMILQVQPELSFQLPSGLWVLSQQSNGFPLEMLSKPWTLQARRGGEVLHMQGKLGRRPLKKNLQDAKLAPWQREQVHLLLIEQQVMGVFTAQGFWPVANLPREAHGYLPTLLSEKA